MRVRRFAAMMIFAALVTGCVGAVATPSVSVAPAASHVATTPPTPPPTASPTATPTPSPTPDSLTDIAAAPSGTWKSVRWIALPAAAAPGAPSADPSSTDTASSGATFEVFGWSKGYVGFTITPKPGSPDATEPIPPNVRASYSTDGVHWHLGQTLDPTAAGSMYLSAFRSVIEGPNGLLAVGWTGGCASEYLDSLWTSSDGVSWQPVNVRGIFGDTLITYVSGGGAGFTAVAYRGAGAWTSRDGRIWKRVSLKAAAFANAVVDDGTALAGSFVLAGTTGTPDCTTTVGPTPKPVLRTAAAWWSADGSTWTRAALPGALATSDAQTLSTYHLSDRSVVAVDANGDAGKQLVWGTHDGRTWQPVTIATSLSHRTLVTCGPRNLTFTLTGDAQNTVDVSALKTIDDDFTVTSISERGDVPKPGDGTNDGFTYGMVALGPTGVLVTTSDGSQMWLGVPSAQ